MYCDDGKTALKKTKPTAVMPDDVMAMLKDRKADLIEWFTKRAEDGATCETCQSFVYLTKTVTRDDVARCCRLDNGRVDCPYESRK